MASINICQNLEIEKIENMLSKIKSTPTEISLIDALDFFKKSYKTILVSCAAGLILSVAYLYSAPRQYEAIAQIAMAQIVVINSGGNNAINPMGVNIEEPSLLITRFSLPSSWSTEVIAACDGLQNNLKSILPSIKSIQFEIPKNVTNIVAVKTVGPTPQAAEDCNLKVFELIKHSQALLVEPYIEEASVRLVDDEQRLAAAKKFILKEDFEGKTMGAAYLSTRDEVRYLLDEIAALKAIVTKNKNRSTRLVSPIYASEIPIAPKKIKTLIVGVLGGIAFGLLIAIARKIIV